MNGSAEKKLAGVPGMFHDFFTWILLSEGCGSGSWPDVQPLVASATAAATFGTTTAFGTAAATAAPRLPPLAALLLRRRHRHRRETAVLLAPRLPPPIDALLAAGAVGAGVAALSFDCPSRCCRRDCPRPHNRVPVGGCSCSHGAGPRLVSAAGCLVSAAEFGCCDGRGLVAAAGLIAAALIANALVAAALIAELRLIAALVETRTFVVAEVAAAVPA